MAQPVMLAVSVHDSSTREKLDTLECSCNPSTREDMRQEDPWPCSLASPD